MLQHRFREHLTDLTPLAAAAPALAGFVPCPCALMATFAPAHQSYVAEVYRVAREMTEAQLASRRAAVVNRIPQFSRN